PEDKQPATLSVPLESARARLEKQIDEGRGLLASSGVASEDDYPHVLPLGSIAIRAATIARWLSGYEPVQLTRPTRRRRRTMLRMTQKKRQKRRLTRPRPR